MKIKTQKMSERIGDCSGTFRPQSLYPGDTGMQRISRTGQDGPADRC